MFDRNKPRASLVRALSSVLLRGSAEAVDAAQPAGLIEVYHNDQLVDAIPNIVPAAMRSYLLKAGYAGGAQISAWYIAPYSGAVDPADTLTGANWRAALTEFVNYSEATRPAWAQDAEAAQEIANGTTLATITCSVAGAVNGIVLVSINTKGADGGTVAAATRFTSQRDLQIGDTLQFKYRMQMNLP